MPRASKLLPSLGHAASGAGGTIVSTLATYPLDLVNTRRKVQRQLRADGAMRDDEGYTGILDAFATIYAREGGLSAFFAGLGPDLAKSAADSFLFFLFYTWFRARRLRANDIPYLSALEELAVGAAAGACAKAFTTPVGNVVTRRQMASFLGSANNSAAAGHRAAPESRTFSETVAEIRREKGLLGLWAGYSASLVLTLNPSMTFFLQQTLKRALVAREHWDEPGGQATFLLAALSKVAATSLTYPFQIAKARVQVSAPSPPSERKKDEGEGVKGAGRRNSLAAGVRDIASETIFATVFRIGQAEGVKALYDGIWGELLKGFFSHGTTMLSKDVIHRLLVRLYFAVLVFLQRYPRLRARFLDKVRGAREDMERRYQQASSLSATEVRQQGTRFVRRTIGSGEKMLVNLLGSGQSSIG